MPQFTVDEEVAALVERLAKPKPFENLTFNAALNRILLEHIKLKGMDTEHELLLAEVTTLAKKEPKKIPSPNPQQWVTGIPELNDKTGLNSWKAICNLLNIDAAGDSARRKLKVWVKTNRPSWPPVPEIVGD